MNNAEKVGQIIRDRRIEKGLTQKDLANELFVESTTISRWECGLGYPSVSILPKLREVLELDINELLIEQYQDNDEQKTVDTKRTEIDVTNLLLRVILLLITTFLLIYLFLRKTKSVTYFFSDAQNKSANTVLFVISIVLLSSLLVVSLIDSIIYLTKHKIATIPLYVCFIISLGLSISSIVLLFSNSNILYFGILSALIQVLGIVSVSLVLLNVELKTIILRTIILIVFGILTLAIFCLLHISITYATINTSTILYEFTLYMPIVIYNSLACYFMISTFSKDKKIIIAVPISVFIALNIIFALQFTSSPIVGTILAILTIVGLINSSVNILYITQLRKFNYGKR